MVRILKKRVISFSELVYVKILLKNFNSIEATISGSVLYEQVDGIL